MKKKICVLIGTFLSLTAMFFGVLQSMNTVSLSSTSADNVGTYTLDITSLSENNSTIKTKDGNTLSFYVKKSISIVSSPFIGERFFMNPLVYIIPGQDLST